MLYVTKNILKTYRSPHKKISTSFSEAHKFKNTTPYFYVTYAS